MHMEAVNFLLKKYDNWKNMKMWHFGCTKIVYAILCFDVWKVKIPAVYIRHVRQYCAAVFIDLAKAFDSVNHHILIGRLNSLGFSNGSPTTSQTEFSVSNRKACCPDLLQSLWGWLFSVYNNDVALAAGDSLIHLYADDTILYTSGPSLDTVN